MERKRGKYMVSNRRILDTSTIFQKGKTHVPISVRGLLNLSDGDKILWVLEDDNIFIESALKSRF